MAFTDSGLSEEKKLIWCGLQRGKIDESIITVEISLLKENIGDIDQFEIDLQDIDNYDQLKTYLINEAGFTTQQAEDFIQKIKNSFEDFDAFINAVNNAESWEEFQNNFGTDLSFDWGETDEGNAVAGLRILDGGGVTYAGVQKDVTTAEIFGQAIEFSQTGPPVSPDGEIKFSNLRADTTLPNIGESVTIKVDVQNTNTSSQVATATLRRDGIVDDIEVRTLSAGETVTVEYTQSEDNFQCFDFSVKDAGPLEICWKPPELVP